LTNPSSRTASRLAIPRFGQVEVNRPSTRVDRLKQVLPLAGDPNKDIVHVPSGRFSFHGAAHAPIDFRTIPLRLAPDRRVVNCQTALRYKLFQVAETQAETEAPPDAGYDHFWRGLRLT
jgi:hypothetical protein